MADDSSLPTRRQAVSRLAAGAIAVVGGAAVIGDPPTSPTAAADAGTAMPEDAAVNPDATPIDETEVPYAVWQYNRVSSGFEPTSPINLVSPLDGASFESLIDVFRDAGWSSMPEEYARYAYDRSTDEYVLQKWTGAESHFGTTGRHHVRCWELDGTASVQAHVDTAAAPKHGIASYADSRHGIEQLFIDAGWSVDEDRIAFRNDTEPDHDGYVSVLRTP